MSDKIKLEFNGNTIALDTNKPVPIPGKQEDGSHRFFQVCCCCGLTHAVHLTSETMEFNQIDNTENKKISQALAKRILDAEDKVSAQAAKIEELENELADEAKECHEYYQKNLDLEAKLEKARENFKKIWLKGSGHKIKVFQEMADEALREIGEEGK